MIKIGYLGDGPWAHKAFHRLIQDKTIEIKFVTVRYDKQDPELVALAEDNHIPVEIYKNINSDEFLDRVLKYGCGFVCIHVV